MTRLHARALAVSAALAVSVSCSDQPRSAAAAAAPAEATAGDHATAPHGDHTPHHGGTVYMNRDLHFEVVMSRDGTHRLYFSDAARAALPAATASDVSFTFSKGEAPIETLQAEVDGTGESWIAKGTALPLESDAVTVRVAFVVNEEPYWIDVPFLETAAAGPAATQP